MFNKKIIQMCLTLVIFSGVRFGQLHAVELTPQSGLKDYLAYASLHNPQVKVHFHAWKAALEKSTVDGALPDPRFNYAYFIEEVETRVGPQRQKFGLSQTFPWFGTLSRRKSMAFEQAQTARQGYEAAKLKLFNDVKSVSYEYFYLGQAIGIVRENRDLIQHLEAVARARYRTSIARHADIIRAQVELGKLEDRLASLKDLRMPLMAQFNAVLNRSVTDEIPFPVLLKTDSVDLNDQLILDKLATKNPQLKALGHQVDKQKHALRLARKSYFPDITLGVDYIDTGKARMPGVSSSGKDSIAAMASINVPLWFHKNRAKVKQAYLYKQSAEQQKNETHNRLASQVKLLLYHVRDAQRKINLYDNALLPKAKQSLEATEAAFQSGKSGFLDLVDAERLLLEFELAHLRARVDFAQNLAQLEMHLGQELPQQGVTL